MKIQNVKLSHIKNYFTAPVIVGIVVCVMYFFAFAAAILYTAGMLTAQSNQRLKEERCYQLAKSYSDVLKNELTK